MTCRVASPRWLLAVGVFAVTGAGFGTARAAQDVCGKAGYSYAGVIDARPAHGVRATLVVTAKPHVVDGHIAAWVGVGGPGMGPGGTDVWIQVGISTFTDGTSRLYFEVNRPDIGPRYTQLEAGVPVGARYRLAVLELSARPGWWRVWTNGVPASPAVFLPGSSGSWQPMVTAETWDGGRRVCNRFAYRFEEVGVLTALGGAWDRLRTGHTYEDVGYRVSPRGESGFTAHVLSG
jgi:hypothetical protein